MTTTKVVLTDLGLRSVKPAPAGKRVMIWDAGMPNLAVRVTDQGVRSFVVARRVRGDKNMTWHTRGRYPDVTLAEARRLARDSTAVMRTGADPREPALAEEPPPTLAA